jgi:vacuolar-type H+-ATPase subunit C/Vma6
VTRSWEDLVARVRGLSTRFVDRSRMIELAASNSLAQLATRLAATRVAHLPEVAAPLAEELELSVRRTAAERLRTLERWTGTRDRWLAPLYLDQDRRSVRALLRGAEARSPAAERLAGLVPTPLLPERALYELAAQPSVAAVAALLAVWGHPFGRALLADARLPHPDLFRLDLVVNRTWATSSLRAARRAPRRDRARADLEMFVRQTIDTENIWTALQLAAGPSGMRPEDLFLSGGRWLDRAAFSAATGSSDVAGAVTQLERATRRSPLAGIAAGRWEATALETELRRARAAARRSPLGAAPVIAFFVRLRAEVRDLCLIIWRVALGAPPVAARDLVTLP